MVEYSDAHDYGPQLGRLPEEERDDREVVVNSYLAILSPKEREAFILHYGSNLTYSQTAEVMNLSYQNTKAALKRGRRKLHEPHLRNRMNKEERALVGFMIHHLMSKSWSLKGSSVLLGLNVDQAKLYLADYKRWIETHGKSHLTP
jgi:DNA-binding CsgD family transcriptional regulator